MRDYHNPISNFKNIGKKESVFYLSAFLFGILLLGYVIPAIISPLPWGSDVYFHMENTDRMFQTDSLVSFYERSFNEEYLGYDYPFGMWYFGSIVMKVTGIDVHLLAILFPLILSAITLIVYYVYALKLVRKKESAVLSLIFLISMPFLALNFLNYSTSRFISIFLIMVLYIIVDENQKWQDIPILILIVFSLAITHTGTYIFLIFFLTALFFLYTFIRKKFDWWIFFGTIITIFIYVITVQEFQFVQPQYIDKGRLIISISEKIARFSGLDIVREMGIIFYDNIFVGNNMSYAIFWSAIIFSGGILALWLRRRIQNWHLSHRLTLPIIGNVGDISHGIMSTPFWIGPVQTFLSVFGVFMVDTKGKCIFLALVISSLFPGALQTSSGTGSLRETYYLFLIIPVTAAAGLLFLLSKIEHLDRPPRQKKILSSLLLIVVLISSAVVPVVAGMHFAPQISGSSSEIENLRWLSGSGDPTQGVADFAYRERIDLYSGKITPGIPSGAETKRYLRDLRNIYFSSGAEKYATDLYSFNIQYLIASDRILDAYSARPSDLKIDYNTNLDKIFTSDGQFGIYHYNDRPTLPSQNQSLPPSGLVFDGKQGVIRDFGSSYLVETDYYKMRLEKNSPSIQYLGTKNENMLGEGLFLDVITLITRGTENSTSYSVSFNDITDTSVAYSGNTLQYSGILKGRKVNDNAVTIQVIYTFHEKCIEREIRLINDRKSTSRILDLNIILASQIFAPFSEFSFIDLNEKELEETTRRIYPSQDLVPLKDIRTNQVFLNNNGKGILMRYMNTAPYPSKILYGGSTIYEYGTFYIESRYSPSVGEAYDIVQYFAIGEKSDAERIIDEFTSVSAWDYPGGILPLVLYDPQKRNSTSWEGKISSPVPPASLESSTTLNLKYNLDTISRISGNSTNEAIGLTVSPPMFGLFEEGRRNLKEAFYEGEPSGVLMVPVSLPMSVVLSRGYDENEVFDGWTKALNSAVEQGGVTVFFCDPEDFTTNESLERLNTLLSTAVQQGMTVSSLDPLVAHKLLMKNISADVDRTVDSVVINVTNRNPGPVSGVTFKVILPKIDGDCRYAASGGGDIARIESHGEDCVVYLSCNLAPGETKNLTIEPTITRKRFGIDFTKLFHGTNTMVIKDDQGNPVSDALIRIDTRSYVSNDEGEVKFYVRRGDHTISVEKPGFRSRDVTVYIKPKLFRYLNLFMPGASF